VQARPTKNVARQGDTLRMAGSAPATLRGWAWARSAGPRRRRSLRPAAERGSRCRSAWRSRDRPRGGLPESGRGSGAGRDRPGATSLGAPGRGSHRRARRVRRLLQGAAAATAAPPEGRREPGPGPLVTQCVMPASGHPGRPCSAQGKVRVGRPCPVPGARHRSRSPGWRRRFRSRRRRGVGPEIGVVSRARPGARAFALASFVPVGALVVLEDQDLVAVRGLPSLACDPGRALASPAPG